jgi:hypothetical protein
MAAVRITYGFALGFPVWVVFRNDQVWHFASRVHYHR